MIRSELEETGKQGMKILNKAYKAWQDLAHVNQAIHTGFLGCLIKPAMFLFTFRPLIHSSDNLYFSLG